jgi:hypothetical protein
MCRLVLVEFNYTGCRCARKGPMSAPADFVAEIGARPTSRCSRRLFAVEIASIRPSAGRIPDAGFVPREDRLLTVQLMHVQGPMAQRVANVRLGLRALMGTHPRDPWSIDAPFEGPPLCRPIRVAVLSEPPGGSTDPKVPAVVRRGRI